MIRVPGVNYFRGVTAIIEENSYVNLIDCASVDQSQFIFDYLRKNGSDPRWIQSIIVTHFDHDHAGGASEIRRETGCKILAPEFFDTRVIQGERFTREELAKMFPSYTAAELDYFKTKIDGQHYPPYRVDATLTDGAHLPIGDGAEIISIPGHTPGHVVVYLPKKSLVVAGDTAEVKDGKLSPQHHATVCMRQASQSLRKLSKLDFEILVPSHFEPILRGANRALNEFLETVE